MSQPLRVYAMDISYFSGKFEAYLRYKGIEYQRIEAHHAILYGEVYRNTGTMKVPAVALPDGRWLKDTTPMIRYLERQYPAVPVIPADPVQAFLASLLEDYADEWLWRPAMWWRWMPRGSARLLGDRIAREVLGSFPGPRWLKARYFAWRQRQTWLWSDGMTRRNQAQIRDMYPQQLDALQAILSRQPYLLGDTPSIADFGYFASMFRHFGNDPDSAVLMRQQAPAVYEWLARLWNARADEQSQPQWQLPQGEGYDFIWKDLCQHYLPYLRDNAQAFAQGRARFDFAAGELHWPGCRVSDYRVWCRQELQREFAALSAEERQAVERFLESAGGLAALHELGEIDSGLDEEFVLPLRPPAPVSWWHRLQVWVSGNARQARA